MTTPPTPKSPPALMDELRLRVEDVRKLAGSDPDRAHGAEDELLRLALSHILYAPMTLAQVRRVAEIALEVDDIEYTRHTA